MHGVIIQLLVEPGMEVSKDQPVIIIEAMKMEHTLCAPADGTVTGFYFQAGDQVEGGAELLDFVPEEVE
jgi:3-methylcrotonyl-CoA carboxylase alpha subunit